MDSVVYYNSLYDIYGALLTDKQKKYFEDYYCNNLSFSEMAEDYGVSRNAIFNQVHSVILKLEEYEEKLMLLKKKNIILSVLSKIDNDSLKKELEEII